jgi:uncharacterized membrane protein
VTEPSDGTQPDATKKILVGITFGDPFRAQEFLTETRRLAALGSLELIDAVIVTKQNDGHTHVTETIDPTVGRSAFSGAVWAGLFGLLLGGPVGWLAGAAVGAGAGAAAAKVVDLGIPDAWVEWFRAAVRPDSTTVALLVAKLDREALVTEAGRFTGAELIYADLDDSTIDRISEAFGSPPPPADHRRDVASAGDAPPVESAVEQVAEKPAEKPSDPPPAVEPTGWDSDAR